MRLSFFLTLTFLTLTFISFGQVVMPGVVGQGPISLIPNSPKDSKYDYINPEATLGLWNLSTDAVRVSTGFQSLFVNYSFKMNDLNSGKIRVVNSLGNETLKDIQEFNPKIKGTITILIEGQYQLLDGTIKKFKQNVNFKVPGEQINTELFTYGPDLIADFAKIRNETGNSDWMGLLLGQFNCHITKIEATNCIIYGYDDINNQQRKIITQQKNDQAFEQHKKDGEQYRENGEFEKAIDSYRQAANIKREPELEQVILDIQEELETKKTALKEEEKSKDITDSSEKPYSPKENGTIENKPITSSIDQEKDNVYTPAIISEPYFANSYDYFSVEEMKKSQKNATYYMETFNSMVQNDIEQNKYKKQFNEVLRLTIPLDPMNIIEAQNRRDQEAISLLEQKQSSARKAANEQELRAINSANSPLELSVLTGTASVMKVVNEITFRREQEQLLLKLKKKREREIDKLYSNVVTPLKKNEKAYAHISIYQIEESQERSALEWKKYYADLAKKTKQNFSYYNTNWAIPERIQEGVNKPKNEFTYVSNTLSVEELKNAAKRKMAAVTNQDHFFIGQITPVDFDYSKLQLLFDERICYQLLSNDTNSLPNQVKEVTDFNKELADLVSRYYIEKQVNFSSNN